jgi:cell division septation protein DedD
MDQAKQTAGQVVGQVKEQASLRLSGQIEQAAEGLTTATETIRGVSQQLRDNGQEPMAEYVDRAAQYVDRFSTYLHGKDLDALVSDVEHFARRQPQMFIAGALGLGMLAARFLKSTPERTETKITVSDNLSTPRFTPGWRSPTEYHGIETPTPSSPGMSASMPSSGTPMTSSSVSTPSTSTPSTSTPSTTTPSTSTPSVPSTSRMGTSPTIGKPEDVPQSTEPMKPITPPTTGDHDSELRRSA